MNVRRAGPAMDAMLRGVRTVLGDEGFQIAFVVAALGTRARVVVAARTVRSRVGFALVAVVAALVGLRFEYDIDARFVIGLALLGLAWLIDPSATRCSGSCALLGGAILVLGVSSPASPRWMQVVGFVGDRCGRAVGGEPRPGRARDACRCSCW